MLNEQHLLQVLREYVAYNNESRVNQSLGGNAPFPRDIETVGAIMSKAVLGGLHCRYSRAAA